MKVRYKKYPDVIRYTNSFNVLALAEVNMYDDSAFIRDLEVYVSKIEEWKDMNQAFEDKDIIVNNYNTKFFEPQTEEDRQRGYSL